LKVSDRHARVEIAIALEVSRTLALARALLLVVDGCGAESHPNGAECSKLGGRRSLPQHSTDDEPAFHADPALTKIRVSGIETGAAKQGGIK
jgi:hypothetical protein